MTHDELKAEAIKAIDRLEADTRVSMETTIDSLEEVREEINKRIEAIRESIEAEAGEGQ